MVDEVIITINILPQNNFQTTYTKSKTKVSVIQSPIIKDFTSAEESISLIS